MNEDISKWSEDQYNTFVSWLTDMLKMGEVTVTFTKKDGSERVMLCTLDPDKLPKIEVTENKKERKKSNEVIAVYDVESRGWRSFSVKSIKSVNIKI